MRRLLALFALILAACGEDGEPLPPGITPADSAQCRACFDRVVIDSGACGDTLEACIAPPDLTTDGVVLCFLREGQCQDRALETAAVCYEGCGDDPQAAVARCTGDCFLERALCAERVLRQTDACLETCTPSACSECTRRGAADFDGCDAQAVSCADTCVATHRGE